MKKLLVIMLCILLCGCGSENKKDSVEKIMAEEEYVIVDVRTNEEYNESHLKDSINIPYDQINENVNLDKEKVVFVYCKSGNRSKIAYDNLTNLGYEVYDLGAFEKIDLPKE